MTDPSIIEDVADFLGARDAWYATYIVAQGSDCGYAETRHALLALLRDKKVERREWRPRCGESRTDYDHRETIWRWRS